jgi:AcrR family transcriptional regulator
MNTLPLPVAKAPEVPMTALHPSDSRARLLEAARALFARNGYEGTSVRAITGRAKANLGAVTYHFGSKEALYHAVIEQFIVPVAERLAAISASDEPALSRLETVLRELLKQTAAHPEMPALMIREMASERPVPPPMAKNVRRNAESIGRIIADGQREGTIRPGLPQFLALAVAAQPLFLALAGRAIQQALGADPKDPQIRARLDEQVVETVLAGLASTSGERRA